MERAAGFVHDDTAQGKLDKLGAILAQTSTSNADATLFVEMLSLPSDGRYPKLDVTPEQRRQRTLGALVSQMEALARKNAVLMIFEDTHWTDPTSLELLGLIIDRIPRLRVLLIGQSSSRPGSDGLTLRLSPLIGWENAKFSP
jgi:predicted ATPase